MTLTEQESDRREPSTNAREAVNKARLPSNFSHIIAT